MKIIISPAKKMKINVDDIARTTSPLFLTKASSILSTLKSMEHMDLQALWKCNDKIALENFSRISSMDLTHNLTPALLAYDGIQYKYMAPTIFEDSMLTYVTKHLRILSGFYGVLRPLDGVTPYRLELQGELSVNGSKNLYDYWGDSLYKGILEHKIGTETHPNYILNLASKEYSKAVEKYLQPHDHMITCIFGELVKDKVVQKATYAKMARGEMVRYMAEHNITNPSDIKRFDRLDFSYYEALSDASTYIFIRS